MFLGSEEKRFQPSDIVLSPGMPMELAVRHYCIGILILEYPAPPDEKSSWVERDALRRYGPNLKQTLENIYAEVERTRKTAHVRITWEDGAPVLTVTKRGMILVPGDN